MYGVPDPHSLLRPWKNLQEFTEELFAMMRPVPGTQVAPAFAPERAPDDSGVGPPPSQPATTFNDTYEADFDDQARVISSSVNRTVTPRRQRLYDTSRSSTVGGFSEQRSPAQGYRSEPSWAQASQQRAARQTAERLRATQARQEELARFQPTDLTDINSAIGIARTQAQIAKIAPAPQTLLTSGALASQAFVGGQSFFACPAPATGSFVSCPGLPAPLFIAPPAVPAMPFPNPGGLQAPIYAGPFGAPWLGVSQVYQAPAQAPFTPPPAAPVVPYLPKRFVYPKPTPGPDFPQPVMPSDGGGAGGTIGKVVSGSGDTYQCVLYSNGPDNASDNNGQSQTVKILMSETSDQIPTGTWLFGVLQLEDADGNPLYYAQYPVWLD